MVPTAELSLHPLSSSPSDMDGSVLKFNNTPPKPAPQRVMFEEDEDVVEEVYQKRVTRSSQKSSKKPKRKRSTSRARRTRQCFTPILSQETITRTSRK